MLPQIADQCPLLKCIHTVIVKSDNGIAPETPLASLLGRVRIADENVMTSTVPIYSPKRVRGPNLMEETKDQERVIDRFSHEGGIGSAVRIYPRTYSRMG